MARDLVVRVIGDSRSLERAMGRSSKAVQGFGASVDKSTKQISGFGRGVVGGFAGSLALTGALSAMTDVVKLAAESEQVLGQTQVALESAGKSWEQYGDEIEKTIKAQSQFGFDDEALLRTFSLFVRQSGNVTEALRRNRIAMDVARARFIDLEQAANLVNKAALGQAGALRRIGIDAQTGASGVELLTMLEQKFGGAAEAASDDAATAMERLNVQIENAKESIGTLLLPLVTGLAKALGDAATAAEALGTGLGKLGDIGAKLVPDEVKRFGGIWKTVVMQLNPVTAAYTRLGWAADFLKDKLGLANDEAVEATHNFSALAQLTQGLPAQPLFGTTSPMAAPLTPEQRRKFFDANIARQLERVQGIPTLSGQIGALQDIAGQIRAKMKTTKDATSLQNLDDQLWRIQQDILAKRKQIEADADQAAREQEAAAKERQRAAAEAARQQLETQLGWLEFAVERAEATKTLKDDLKTLRAVEEYWKERIRTEGRTLELMTELWRTQQRIKEVGKKTAGDDPIAGVRQVSSAKLARILAAGTGLGAAGLRTLGRNIAGAEIQPVYVNVTLDGREVSRSVTTHQARTGNRTAKQTSGRRG